MIRLELLIKKKKKEKNNITSCPNASLGGDEWGQSYYSFELLRCGGKTADIQSSMTFGVCYFFLTFFNSWARDLWLDKCFKLFFFSNGDNLNTPHRQRGLFSFFLCSSCSFCSSVSHCLAVLLWFFPFSFLFQPGVFPAICTIVDVIYFIYWDLLYRYMFECNSTSYLLEIHDLTAVFLSLMYVSS